MLEIGEVKVKISLDCEEVNKVLNEYKEVVERLQEENRLAKDEIERLEIDKKDMQDEINYLMWKVKERDEALENTKHLKAIDTINTADKLFFEFNECYPAQLSVPKLGLRMSVDRVQVDVDRFKKKRIIETTKNGMKVSLELNYDDEAEIEFVN